MSIDENSIVSQMNPLLTIGGFVLLIAVSAFCAWKYRDTNDFGKAVRLSIGMMAVFLVGLVLMGLPLFMAIGMLLCTFAVTAWFSDYFFYH
jgi:uncharacterized membrane protein